MPGLQLFRVTNKEKKKPHQRNYTAGNMMELKARVFDHAHKQSEPEFKLPKKQFAEEEN